MSGEDMWPRWLSTLFRQVHGTRLFHHTEKHPRSGTNRTESGQRLKFKIPVVCAPCNHNWMSRAENAVKPILSSLISNPSTDRKLTYDERRSIAMWIAIKAVVLDHHAMEEYGQPKPFFSPQQRTMMRTLQMPPRRISVYMARLKPPMSGNRGDYQTLYYSNFPAKAEKYLRAFVVTVSANEVAIQLIASKMAKRVPLVPVQFNYVPLLDDWSHYAPQIWPDRGDVFWPPIKTLRRFDTLSYRVGERPS